MVLKWFHQRTRRKIFGEFIQNHDFASQLQSTIDAKIEAVLGADGLRGFYAYDPTLSKIGRDR